MPRLSPGLSLFLCFHLFFLPTPPPPPHQSIPFPFVYLQSTLPACQLLQLSASPSHVGQNDPAGDIPRHEFLQADARRLRLRVN